jgi:hypothetical protein
VSLWEDRRKDHGKDNGPEHHSERYIDHLLVEFMSSETPKERINTRVVRLTNHHYQAIGSEGQEHFDPDKR